MKIADFEQRIEHAVLVADGAMGSMLIEAAGLQRFFEELNASQPEAVFRVHQAYIEAGAQIIETNTFGANRSKLAALGLADQVTRINHRGAKIARESRGVAAEGVRSGGSIGPLDIAPEMNEVPREEMLEIYREQAQALEERGVDFFVLETFSNMDMLVAAIDAVRSFSSLPIVAELTFSEEGTTLGGTRPAEAAARLAQQNVQVMGVNCTLGPQSLLHILSDFAGGHRALSAMPNVGFPKRVGDRTVYPRSSPEYFALFAREAAALGARIVGGCVGTTPEHVRAIAGAGRGLKPAQPVKATSGSVLTQPEKARMIQRDPESGLWRKLKAGEFAVSVEIDPPKGIALERIFEQVEKITASGCVDTIDINIGTLSRVG